MIRRTSPGFVIIFVLVAVLSAWTQTAPVKIGELDLTVGGLSATVTPAQPVIPKDVSSGVQIVVTLNGQTLSAAAVAQYLGGSFQIRGEYSGPGLSQTVDVPQSPAINSLVLDLPAVDEAGNYTLSNLRFMVNGNDAFDLSPNSVVVNVIDQVLVTSVQTQALTLAQIQAAGVVLDSNDYTGFQFTVGLQLSSQLVNISFPVVFNSQGVAVPQPLSPPSTPTPQGVSVPVTVVPVLLQVSEPPGGGGGPPPPTLPNGQPIRIPSVLVIPGNVGYLKQFFSAQLYVTNDTPGEASLVVDNLSGTINLPPGPDNVVGTADDPLGLPNLTSGPEAVTMPIVLNGASTLSAGQTGQAAWTIVGNSEGFYSVNFGINATLEGLPTGPVNLTGSASGGVLVRNPYFNMTFTVPGVVRSGENFNVYATVTNTSQAMANNLTVAINAASLSGAKLVNGPTVPIATLNPGDSTTLTYTFEALTTGKVVADYLHFDTQSGTTGQLNFTLGVYGNGTPMSPDTIVLPSAVDNLPSDIVNAAMRVLGQAWSVANAPPGTLPAGIKPTSTSVVTQKALALSEAGLRQTLGESLPNALRDLAPDWWGGSPVDPGFNQVLQQTPAGQNFTTLLGSDLAQPMIDSGGPLAYELQLSQLEASGPNFLAFAVGNGASPLPATVSLTDGSGNQLSTTAPGGTIPGGVLLSLGSNSSSPVLGLVTAPTTSPYTLSIVPQISGVTQLSISIPHGDGTVIRGQVDVAVVQGKAMRVIADLSNPNSLVLQVDTNGDGSFATSIPMSTQVITPTGPSLTSATVIGPETVSQAGPFGLNMVLLFDRIVDATTSSTTNNYTIPNNSVQSASRQLSGRLVFGNLTRPEGPYVATTAGVGGIADQRGNVGPSSNVTLQSRLLDPGAVVSGRVLNADGTTSSTATVTYSNSPYPPCQGSGMQGLAATPVNGSGFYQFRYVHQDSCGGPFAVATTDPNTGALRQLTSYVRARGQQIVLDLAMLGLGSVTGQVTDLSHAPVADAQVVAISGTDPQVGGQAYTDGNGDYTINGITVGPFTVKAGKGNGLGTNAGNIERAGTTAVVNVTLNGGAVKVSGIVTQVQNGVTTPVAGLPVAYYQPYGGDRIAMGYVLTASDGSYVLTGMPTGSYTVEATLGSGLTADDSGVAAAGNNIVANLTIVIPTTAVVDGVVTFANGSPAPGVLVYQGQLGVLSHPDGTFSLGGVPVEPSQSQTIYARTVDGLRSGQTTVVVNSASAPITGAAITLSGLGSAQFTVKDANGNLVANQQVTIASGGAGGCAAACGCNAQTTNASGVVTFTGLPVGSISGSALNSSGDFAKAVANIQQDGLTGYGVIQFHGTGTVTGSVVDPSNNPVLGATVQLSSNVFNADYCSLVQTNSQSLQTGPTGTFQFNSVLVGAVGVTASQSFYPTQVGAQGALTKNGSTLNLPPLRMVNTVSGVLSGVVYLPDGVTPAGAGVQVTANGPLPNVTVNTDATGTFTFAKIFPQGMYTLSAADPVSGGVNQMNVYLIAGQNTTQNLRLLGTGTVNVTVVDGAGVPVGAAYVTLNENGYPNAAFNGSLNASNQGVISFPDVFEGNFSVQVVDPYGRGGRASGVLPQGTSSVNIQVQQTTTGTVVGTYYMPDGVTPIPNATVNLTASGRVIGQATTLGTGKVGSYEFDYVPAGSVQLNAQDPLTGRTGIAVGSIAKQNDELPLNVIAEGLDTVQGLVTGDGSPQPGASVSITSGSFQATTSANSSGIYLMTGVPEGVVVVTASLGNGFLTGTATAPVSGDSNVVTLNVSLRSSGSVTGQVVQADGVTPATASVVTISVGGTGGGTLSTTTDGQGNFAFNLVPAGTAAISVQVLGSIDQGAATVTVPAGSNVATKVTLNGIGSLSGVALNSSGQPTPGTIILNGTGQFPYYLIVTAAADGTFALPQVLAGPFTAHLSADIGGFMLHGTSSGTVSPYQNYVLSIQVQPSGTIAGVVLRPDGQTPAVGANIAIQSLNTGANITLQAQNDGSFTAIGVPLGAFTVQINDPISGGMAAILGQSIASDNQTVNLGTITLDGNALSIVVSNPANGTTGVGINQPLIVTFSEALSSTNGIYVTNGTSNVGLGSSLSSDGKTVTLQGTLPDGLHLALNVTSQVTDVFGRQLLLPQVIQFTTVDLTPPYVVSIVPANQTIQVPTNTTVAVTFNKSLSASAVLDNVIALSSVSGTVAGNTSLTAPNTLVFTPSASLMNNTIYTVTVNGAVSFGDNVQTNAFTSSFVSPETATPVLQLTSPVASSYINTATPTITILFSDQLTGINPASGSLMLDGQAVTPSVSAASMTFTPATALASGAHTISASVQNNAGVAGVLSASFIVDTTPPSVAILTGISASDVLKGQVAISGSATDAISGIAKINFLVDGTVQAVLTGPSFSSTFDTTQLPDGPHNFTVQAVNNAGTSGPAGAAVQAFVENVTLSVSITSPVNGAPFKGQVGVTATASEPVQKITFTMGTQTVTAAASPYQGTLSLSGLPDGPQTITAAAYDFAGDSASATVTITVKQTAPPAPNGNLIFAEPPSNGVSLVHGLSGAVTGGGLTISVTDTVSHAAAAPAISASDGSFATTVAAAIGDTLSITATDSVGNVSAATLVTVRQTASLPPSAGNTSLVYEGDLVDRVGGGPIGLSPDGQPDAVFILSVNVGQGITRTISYVNLVGPQTFSTQSSNLGVAADVGSTLLNSSINGQINFGVTTGATLTLFATDNGFIQPGDTYTATAVFTDGSRFVASYTYVAPADRQYVAHSSTITANPPTIVVNGSTPGTSTITITNIRDINGSVVPDGANIALSAANMATVNPAGTPVPSAGGAFIDGTTAANNPNFQVYTIKNGTVTATYSSQSVTANPWVGTTVVIQMQAADANGNVLGTRVVASQDINIRASTDTAIVSISPGSLYADRGDHRSHVTVVLRDANGNVLPDGAQAAISVQGGASYVPGYGWISSAGGALLNIPNDPANGSYALGTMAGGQIAFTYSDSGVYQGTNGTSPAVLQVVPVDGYGNITSNNAMGTGNITIVGAAIADINPSQPSVPQVSPAEPLQVLIQDVHDARGNLAPDGSNVGMSASSGASYVSGYGWIPSAGGTILNGTPDLNNSAFNYFPLVSNGFVAMYSTDGSGIVPPGQTELAALQLVMVDPSSQVLDTHAITVHDLVLVPPSNAVGSSQPASILGDGAIHTATITFKPILDAFGNTVPDGTVLAVSANSGAAYLPGYGWMGSAGGQIVSGTPSASSPGYNIHTVQGGALIVTYADQNVTSAPGQELTANIVVLEANGNGQVTSSNTVASTPVTIAGVTSAQGAANPTEIVADGGQHVLTVTFSNFRDAAGNPVPDGTQVAVTAADGGSYVPGYGWISSAGGVVIGGTPASFGSQYSIFTITNGQIVLQYSSQGVSGNSRPAVVQVVSVTPSGSLISTLAVATLSIQFPGSASVSVSPTDLTANGLSNQSAVIISGLKDADGVTPVPNGALVGLTSVPNATYFPGVGYPGGAGGTLTAAGTSPGDGTLATNNSNFQQFTVAGGQVSASYSDMGITAGVGQTVEGYIAVVPLASDGSVLTTTAIGWGAVNLHGVTATTANGPTTLSLSANSTASVTFSGIKDSAGNTVPDGTAVAVTVGSGVTYFAGWGWVSSVGGTIVNGNPSPQNGTFQIFSTLGGSITVTYSTTGASIGTASVQILPATPDGNVIGNQDLYGGVWPITITY